MNDKASLSSNQRCYEGRGGISGKHCNFYPKCVCGDRDALRPQPNALCEEIRNIARDAPMSAGTRNRLYAIAHDIEKTISADETVALLDFSRGGDAFHVLRLISHSQISAGKGAELLRAMQAGDKPYLMPLEGWTGTAEESSGLRPGELEQLRRIDKAARDYVDGRESKSGEAYNTLQQALFDGRPVEPSERTYEEVRRLSDDDIIREALDSKDRLTREIGNRYDIAVVKLREAEDGAVETSEQRFHHQGSQSAETKPQLTCPGSAVPTTGTSTVVAGSQPEKASGEPT